MSIFPKASRQNVLRDTNNFVNAIVNAIVAGYRSGIVIEDIMDEIKSQEVSRGTFAVSPEAVVSHFQKYLRDALKIAEAMKQCDFYENKQPVRQANPAMPNVPQDSSGYAGEAPTVTINRLTAPDEDADEEYGVSEEWDEMDSNENVISGCLKIRLNKSGLSLEQINGEKAANAIFDFLLKENSKLTIDNLVNANFSKMEIADVENGIAKVRYSVNR